MRKVTRGEWAKNEDNNNTERQRDQVSLDIFFYRSNIDTTTHKNRRQLLRYQRPAKMNRLKKNKRPATKTFSLPGAQQMVNAFTPNENTPNCLFSSLVLIVAVCSPVSRGSPDDALPCLPAACLSSPLLPSPCLASPHQDYLPRPHLFHSPAIQKKKKIGILGQHFFIVFLLLTRH